MTPTNLAKYFLLAEPKRNIDWPKGSEEFVEQAVRYFVFMSKHADEAFALSCPILDPRRAYGGRPQSVRKLVGI